MNNRATITTFIKRWLPLLVLAALMVTAFIGPARRRADRFVGARNQPETENRCGHWHDRTLPDARRNQQTRGRSLVHTQAIQQPHPLDCRLFAKTPLLRGQGK